MIVTIFQTIIYHSFRTNYQSYRAKVNEKKAEFKQYVKKSNILLTGRYCFLQECAEQALPTFVFLFLSQKLR